MSCAICGENTDSINAIHDNETGVKFCDEQCANIAEHVPIGLLRRRARGIRNLTNWEAAFKNLFEQLFEYADRKRGSKGLEDKTLAQLKPWAVTQKQLGLAAEKLDKAAEYFESMLKVKGVPKEADDSIESLIRQYIWDVVRYVNGRVSGKIQRPQSSGVGNQLAGLEANFDVTLMNTIQRVMNITPGTTVVGRNGVDEKLAPKLKQYLSIDGLSSKGSVLLLRVQRYVDQLLLPKPAIDTKRWRTEAISDAATLGLLLDSSFKQKKAAAGKRDKNRKADERKLRRANRKGTQPEDNDLTLPDYEEVDPMPPTNSAPLPEGWEEFLDDDGVSYYYNSVTGNTTYARPTGSSTVPPATLPVPSSTPGETPGSNIPVPPPMPANAQLLTVNAPRSLPEDWHTVYDDTVGAFYFYNNVLGYVSWKLPDASDEERMSVESLRNRALTIHSVLQRENDTTKRFYTMLASDHQTLLQTLRNRGPFTLFVPTNLAPLQRLPIGKRSAWLQAHIVNGRYTKSKLQRMSSVNNLLLGTLTIDFLKTKQLKIDGALVTESDIITRNGVIHIIEKPVTLPAQSY